MRLRLPSYRQGFARSAAESAFPSQWRGLVGAWCPFLGPSGLTLFDWSGFKAHGTLNNAELSTDYPISHNGKNTGYALDMDGSDDGVTVPNAPHLNLSTQLTLSGWLNLRTLGSGSAVDMLIRKGSDNPNDYQLAVRAGVGAIFLTDADGGGHRTTLSITTGSWFHLCGTWNGTNTIIYINGGNEVASSTYQTSPISPDTRDVFLGGRTSGDICDGFVDDFRIWNRALTAREVLELFQTGRASMYIPRPRTPGVAAVVAGQPARKRMAGSHDVYNLPSLARRVW